MKDTGIIVYVNETARKKYEGKMVAKKSNKCQKCQTKVKQIVEKNYITSEIKEEEIDTN